MKRIAEQVRFSVVRIALQNSLSRCSGAISRMQLFCLQLEKEASCLQLSFLAYSSTFGILLTIGALLLTIGALLLTIGSLLLTVEKCV